MSALKGLGAYKARQQAEEKRREESNSGRFNRFALLKDGDEAIVRFGQEIDFDAKGYDEKAGIGFVNIEHQHPHPTEGWKNRANCTSDSQGQCYACERLADRSVEWDDRKGWKQREKFYINVIGGEPKDVEVNNKTKKIITSIDTGAGDGEVYLLEQGTYNGIWDALSDQALDEETIISNFWKIKRKGSGFNDTSYLLTMKGKVPDDAKKGAEFDLVDIEGSVLREIPYAEQEAFYWKGLGDVSSNKSATAEVETAKGSAAASSPDEW